MNFAVLAFFCAFAVLSLALGEWLLRRVEQLAATGARSAAFPIWVYRGLLYGGAVALMAAGWLFATLPASWPTSREVLPWLFAIGLMGLPLILGTYLAQRLERTLPRGPIVTVLAWVAVVALLYLAWTGASP